MGSQVLTCAEPDSCLHVRYSLHSIVSGTCLGYRDAGDVALAHGQYYLPTSCLSPVGSHGITEYVLDAGKGDPTPPSPPPPQFRTAVSLNGARARQPDSGVGQPVVQSQLFPLEDVSVRSASIVREEERPKIHSNGCTIYSSKYLGR